HNASQELSRRQALAGTLAAAAGAAATVLAPPIARAAEETPVAITKGRINQTVCQWCYAKMKVEDLAANAARMGLKGMDLVGPEHWDTIRKYGLTGTMTPSHPIEKGLNHKENWEFCLEKIRKSVDATADAG